MGNDWDGDGEEKPEMVLVDTGSQFAYVPVKQGPPAPPRVHEYQAVAVRPRKNSPCVCGELKDSPIHLR